RRLERGEFRPRGAAAFALALDMGIAVGDVAMRVDQAGHDPLPAGVDHLDVAAIVELHVGRQRPDALDLVAFDDDGVVAGGSLPGAVDQGAVADHQRLLGCGAHRDLLHSAGRTDYARVLWSLKPLPGRAKAFAGARRMARSWHRRGHGAF